MSSRRRSGGAFAAAVLALLAVQPVCAQYPGQTDKKDKDAPVLRAVGVVEFTGEAGKPKTSRLVPVTVFDGDRLQDAGIYLARPAPLAVQSGVEYILQKDGDRVGLFDVHSAGQVQGAWMGFGTWKAMPSSTPKPLAMTAPAKLDDDEGDKPTLHRKVQPGDTKAGAPAAPADPDRPTLHKKTESDSDASGDSASSTTDSQASNAPATDPDRPVLKKEKPKAKTEIGYVEDLPSAGDPERPKLERGKSDGGVGSVTTPTLMGLPPDMKQVVAVSDARNKPEHEWNYSWANPEDELKMKRQLEEIARQELGLDKPAAQAGKPRTPAAKGKHAPVLREPAPLTDEQFRVFELAYGSGATLVLTARTDGSPEKQKFVTLIGQPDLYGNLLVLFKSVTDREHLDEKPRMRLVDAVDAMADNRGELLFELRGETQRQFALYRVMRGTAEKVFVTGGEVFGNQAMN